MPPLDESLIIRAALAMFLATAFVVTALLPGKHGHRRVGTLALPSRQLGEEATEVAAANGAELKDLQKLVETAIRRRGTAEGYATLQELGEISCRRIPFSYQPSTDVSDRDPKISIERKLVPDSVAIALFDQVKEMEKLGCFNDEEMDSVDGVPSLYLNLVVGGKPVMPMGEELGEVDERSFSGELEVGVAKLLTLVGPHLYGELLPRVEDMVGVPLDIDEVFLRRYGDGNFHALPPLFFFRLILRTRYLFDSPDLSPPLRRR